MAVQLQFRRGTALEWTNANPILAEGELGLELDSNKFKLGNGNTRWNSLLYTSTFNITKDTSSDIAYPTYVTGLGVISAGISTQGLVYKPSLGNIGIATTNPTSKLWVGGDGYFSGIVTAKEFSGDGSKLTGVTGFKIKSSETESTQPQFITFVSTSSTTDVGISTNNLVFIPSLGNLGIGTTNPTSKLWIGGDTLVTGISTIGTVKISSGIVTSTNSGIVTFYGDFVGTATSTTNIPNLSGDITSNNKVTTLATVNSNVGTFGSDTSIPSITVNGKGLVTSVTTNSITVGDGQLSLGVSGTGLSGSATFTANQQNSATFTVTSNATNLNTGNTIVSRDASGNFNAGTITASLTGNVTGNLTGIADTAKKLEVSRNFSVTGDVQANAVSFNGGANVTLNAKLSNNFDANTTGIITASQFSTGASGVGININSNTISGPANLTIDPAGIGDDTGAVRIKGDLFVDGTQTFINSTIIEFADFQIGIGTTATTNLLLDGAGIGIGSTENRKTFTYKNSSESLKSSENLDISSGKTYKINGVEVLSSGTLGTNITSSSLTSVGTLINLSVGNINSTGIITATDFNSASDINLKENIRKIDNPIDKIVKIDGVRFDWKSDNKPSMGVIAQNIEEVLPELVSGEESKTVNYNGIIGLLIECVKTQQEQIDELNKRLDDLTK
jgi:hypothetical protein